MQNRTFVADYPTGFLSLKSDRIQRRRRARRTNGPTLTAVAREKNFATLADRPAVRVVDEEDVCEIVAPAFGKSLPRESAVVGAHYETIGAGSPAERLI